MRHFEKKFLFRGSKGGGGSTPPKPPTLKPPIIGSYKVGASFQFSETIDLISDGPIDGLCNEYGVRLGTKELLQGIFLNGTVIQEPKKTAGQVRVLTNQQYESDSGNLLKTNFNYLFSNLLFNSFLSQQKGKKVETIGREINGDEDKYEYYNFDKISSRLEARSFFGFFNDTTRYRQDGGDWYGPRIAIAITSKGKFQNQNLFRPSNSSDINLIDVIYADEKLEQDYKTLLPKKNEINVLEEANLSFGRDVPISYYGRVRTLRWINTISDYSAQRQYSGFRSTLFGNNPISVAVDPKSIMADVLTRRDLNRDVQRIDLLNKTTKWMSYHNQDADLYSNSKDYFWSKRGVTLVNTLGQFDTDLKFEFGQGIQSIRDYVFRTSSKVYETKSCPYPYEINNCSEVHANNYKSVCRDGTEELIKIVENKSDNEFEYDFLVKQMKTLGWDVPSNLTVNWMISRFIGEFSANSELTNDIKGSKDAICNPFIAFKFEDDYIWKGFNTNHRNTFVDSFKGIKAIEIDLLSSRPANRFRYSVNFLIPVLDKNTGEWNGKCKGFYYSPVDFTSRSARNKKVNSGGVKGTSKGLGYDQYVDIYSIAIRKEEYEFLDNITGLALYQNKYKVQGEQVSKYNFGNVLCEFRQGNSGNLQAPLSYFKDVYIEKSIDRKLIGPFNTNKERRIQTLQNWTVGGITKEANNTHKQRSMLIADQESMDRSSTSYVKFFKGIILDSGGYSEGETVKNITPHFEAPYMVKNFTVAVAEGSLDKRPDGKKKFDFSGWNSYKKNFDEKAQPVTHIITNPDVESCFFTLIIESLYDTLHRDASKTNGDDLGKKVPTIVNIRIEVGYVGADSSPSEGFISEYDRFFRIASLVEQRAPLDIGNPDNRASLVELNYVEELYKDPLNDYKGGLGDPFELPPALVSTRIGQERTYRDRFIRISKLSTESNSTLVFKSLKLSKIVEIIRSNMNYPYSALAGVKIDSRSFEQIPQRSYEARLKKVKIPSNYIPLRRDGTDKRFYEDSSLFYPKSSDALIYNGDWDGTFKYGWTDNPAWIAYDLLTSTRYGLGEFLKEENINKWQLYKIARFCDAVDKDGYFVGVEPNQSSFGGNVGGKEPRYSCNMMFTSATKAYDALNIICSVFKGMVYFSDSSVSFSDDTIKDPVLMFNNSNVQDGFFDYSNSQRDKQYNAIEVSYLDKNDNYRNKIEYIEDQEDVARRGLFKRTIDAYGTTSQSQALRHAKHILFETTYENQSVSFVTSLEGLLCKPGDLVIIEDDMKSLSNNFGKVLDVDPSQGTIRLSEKYENTSLIENSITVYIPTGRQLTSDLDDITSLKRNRSLGFYMDSNDSSFTSKKLNGDYGFSHYSDGFENTSQRYKKDQYAVYTGEKDGIDHFLWYSTEYTGWVFSTGKSFQNNKTYDKYIQRQVGSNGRLNDNLSYLNRITDLWYKFDETQADGRDSGTSISLQYAFIDISLTQGAVDSDIKINETKQIMDFSKSSLTKNDYGSTWTVNSNDENYNLLPLIPEGSVYRIRRKNTDDQVYKVVGIKEVETNKYQIAAKKYVSGKYKEMEESFYKENPEKNSPYNKDFYEAEGTSFVKLATPKNLSISKRVTKNYDSEGALITRVFINCSWSRVPNAQGYSIETRSSSLSAPSFSKVDDNSATINGIEENGGYLISVYAIAESYSKNSPETSFLDSKSATKFIEVNDFEEDLVFDSSAVANITIL